MYVNYIVDRDINNKSVQCCHRKCNIGFHLQYCGPTKHLVLLIRASLNIICVSILVLVIQH
jgi:hypothetical protein